MRLRLLPLFSLIIFTTTLTLPFLYGKSGLTRADSSSENSDKQIVRVYFPDHSTANEIFISFEEMILETNYDEKFHIMDVDSEQMALLIDAGLAFDIDTKWTPRMRLAPYGLTYNGIIDHPCYDTVEETYADAQAIANSNPNLASWIDVGDSWEKTAGLGGHDIMVLVLTNSAILGDKPKFFATAAIHGREYATAPLCLFFAKYLVDNYSIDADATWILDHHEIHLMFHTNPDGRKQAETGLSWRKNTNQNYCGATRNDRGADINRNFEYMWGYGTGSSDNECENNYRGPYAVSEPETQAVQAYMRSIFPDQRDSGSSAAAPDDATGIHIDFHSYSEVVIWPWGYTRDMAPNGIQMQTLGRKFAFWNTYLPRQGIGIYLTDGTIKEFCYGELGVPSFVFELGTEFFQSCGYYEDNIVPDNMPAMIYAAKVARTPYITPAGPNTYSLVFSADFIPSGANTTLTATVDDTQFNDRNGTEPTQIIAAAEYYVDTPPWINIPTPVAISMSPSDGIFNDEVEIVEAQLDTTALSEGKHIIFVRGCDADSNWGAFSAVFLNITNPGFEQVATPIFSPTPETYDGSQGIEIICSSSDAKIYYTINGVDPTEDSTPYEHPIYFNDTITLKARAYKNGWTPSDIVTGNFVVINTDGDGDGFTSNQGDCDDDNINVSPGLAEIPYNGVDDDCNPETLDDDLDKDGFLSATDCDDQNAAINPSAVEIADDGIDQNCDGTDLISTCTDNDNDGFYVESDCSGKQDCNDGDSDIYPGAREIINDGIDQDCDGHNFHVDAEEGTITSIAFLEINDSIYQEEMPDDLICEPIKIVLSIPDAGGIAKFIIYLQSGAPEDYLPYKHTQDGWIDFSRDIVSAGNGDGAEFIDPERKQLKVYITDNSKYDNNSAQGIISDPITVAAPGFVEGQGDIGLGGGGGCFIKSLTQ